MDFNEFNRELLLFMRNQIENRRNRAYTNIIGNGFAYNNEDEIQRVMELSFNIEQENGHTRRTKLTKEEYAENVTIRKTNAVDREMEKDCPICKSIFNTHKLGILHCGHEFHHVCIKQWLQNHGADCPLCKINAVKPQK